MPLLEKPQWQIEQEHEEERQQLDLAIAAEMRKREHEYRLAKLKYSTQSRYKSLEKGIVAIAKAPALLVGVIVIGVLTVKGKKLPDVLIKFMTI